MIKTVRNQHIKEQREANSTSNPIIHEVPLQLQDDQINKVNWLSSLKYPISPKSDVNGNPIPTIFTNEKKYLLVTGNYSIKKAKFPFRKYC